MRNFKASLRGTQRNDALGTTLGPPLYPATSPVRCGKYGTVRYNTVRAFGYVMAWYGTVEKSRCVLYIRAIVNKTHLLLSVFRFFLYVLAAWMLKCTIVGASPCLRPSHKHVVVACGWMVENATWVSLSFHVICENTPPYSNTSHHSPVLLPTCPLSKMCACF